MYGNLAVDFFVKFPLYHKKIKIKNKQLIHILSLQIIFTY